VGEILEEIKEMPPGIEKNKKRKLKSAKLFPYFFYTKEG
jgi:hypothetical protein